MDDGQQRRVGAPAGVEHVELDRGRRCTAASQNARASASESNRTQVPSDGVAKATNCPGWMISVQLAGGAPDRGCRTHLHAHQRLRRVVNSPREYTPFARPSRRRARVRRRPDARSSAPRAADAAAAPATGPIDRGAAQGLPVAQHRAGCAAAARSPSSGVKGRPKEAYFGAVGGGLWKTTDGGENWAPVTDGQITSSSVGAVAVSESNPDVVYIGMGESCIRGNIMPGDGMYKSTDAGKTWTHIGFGDDTVRDLEDPHPSRPTPTSSSSPSSAATARRATSAACSRPPTAARRGGRCCSATTRPARSIIAIDRKNPNVMFAALWEAFRVEYPMSSGGPGSGLFKSTDGGEHWTEITRNPGLPSGVVGTHRRRRVGRGLQPRLRARRERKAADSYAPTTPARRGRWSTRTATSGSARSTTRT